MNRFLVFGLGGCCCTFILTLIILILLGLSKVEQSEWCLKYSRWTESVDPEPLTEPGVKYIGVGNYMISFPNTNKYCYFRNFDSSFVPDTDDVFMPPIEVRTNDGLKVQLELEFVFRLQMPHLYKLFVLVGTPDDTRTAYKNTMVHVAQSVITDWATTFSAQDFYGDRGDVASRFQSELTKALSQRLFIDVTSFQLQPAHFPPAYAAAIVETQEKKQDIQVAEQENKTKTIQKQTELYNARQLAQKVTIKAEGEAEQIRLQNQADVSQFVYRQEVMAAGYSEALKFFSGPFGSQDAVNSFLSYMKIQALKAHNSSQKMVHMSGVVR